MRKSAAEAPVASAANEMPANNESCLRPLTSMLFFPDATASIMIASGGFAGLWRRSNTQLKFPAIAGRSERLYKRGISLNRLRSILPMALRGIAATATTRAGTQSAISLPWQ